MSDIANPSGGTNPQFMMHLPSAFGFAMFDAVPNLKESVMRIRRLGIGVHQVRVSRVHRPCAYCVP